MNAPEFQTSRITDKRPWSTGWLAVIFTLAGLSQTLSAQEHAGPQEVIEKVRKAATLIRDKGDAAFTTLRDRNSEFMWKDTYIFVVNCEADEVMSNPAFPERIGGDIKQHTDYAGKQYGLELCEAARTPGGEWIEYTWPRSGGGEPMRKISFVMSVEGRPYQLGAGIYDETMSLEDLERLIDTPEH